MGIPGVAGIILGEGEGAAGQLDDRQGHCGVGEMGGELGLGVLPGAPPREDLGRFAPAAEPWEVGGNGGAEAVG